ncbi:MAG: hypothetical protein U0798_15825 [Gemmataceae bacterium]
MLALSVQFGGPLSSGPGWGRAALGAVCFAVALLLLRWLFRTEAKLVSRSIARWLFALRALAVSAILVALLFDPVGYSKSRETVPGVVCVAVDISDSMRVAEPHRSLAEKLQLIDALKLADGIATPAWVHEWKRNADSGSGPKFAGPNDPEKAAFEAVLAKVDNLTRLAAAKRILSPAGLGLYSRLQSVHSVDLVGFGTDVRPLSPDLSSLPESAVAADRPTTLTDLSQPLAWPIEQGAGPVVGLVLFTDGRQTWGESPDARLAALAARGIPVYPVVIASSTPPADVAILSAHAQAATVFKGSIVPVEVQVRVTGWPAGLIRVQLQAPKGPPAIVTLGHNGKDTTYSATLKTRLDEAGPQSLIVSAEGEGAEDRLPGNNSRTCRVTVVKDRAKVLLIDGEARWEFHYLHTCLGRDPNMDVRSIVFRQPRMGLVSEEELKNVGTPSLAMPADLDALSSYDCIILGDVEPQQLTPEWRKRLEQYVSDAGGTLVMVAGKRALPMEYVSLTTDPLKTLLPVTEPAIQESETGFPLTLTPDGTRSWFLTLADSLETNRDQWSNFPLHYWSIVGTPKPGAEVLATAPHSSGKTLPILVRQNYGFGRVLYLGIDSTWRWRYKTGDLYHHRFWGQITQWAASDRLLPAVNAAGTIRFGPRESSIKGGRDIEIAVRTADEVKPPKGLKSAVIVRLPERDGEAERIISSVSLSTPEGRPRDLAARVNGLSPGRYAVELNVPEWAGDLRGSPGPNGQTLPLRAPLEIVPPDYSELIDLTPDRDWLQKAATTTGGKVHTVDTLDELMDSLTAKAATRENVVERPWRRSWLLFAIVIGLLGTEWAIRKWSGLM